jgi:peptide/nickel transport system permease protein
MKKRIFDWIVYDLVLKTFVIFIILSMIVGYFLYISPGKVDLTVPVRLETTEDIKHSKDSHFFAFYGRWLNNIMNGNLGRTISGKMVHIELNERIKVTSFLTLGALLLSFFISFLSGLYLIRKSKYRIVNILQGSIFVITALPTFFLAYISIALFSVKFNSAFSFILPIIILASGDGLISELSRIVSLGIKEEYNQPYIETAIAKGLKQSAFFPWPGTTLYHAFRQAVITILPRMGLRIPQIAGLSMVVEKIFSLEGLGDMLLDGLGTKDINCVLIVVTYFCLLIRFLNLSNGLLITTLNPKSRKY